LLEKEVARMLKEISPKERDRNGRCSHDKLDGECPDCEKEQRKGMVYGDFPNSRRGIPIKICKVLGVPIARSGRHRS
jgi:hypothetical protein